MLGKSREKISDGIVIDPITIQTRKEKMLSIEWSGQVLASACWIASVFFYGITSIGDWFQLIAASCWMMSNIASILSIRG